MKIALETINKMFFVASDFNSKNNNNQILIRANDPFEVFEKMNLINYLEAHQLHANLRIANKAIEIIESHYYYALEEEIEKH